MCFSRESACPVSVNREFECGSDGAMTQVGGSSYVHVMRGKSNDAEQSHALTRRQKAATFRTSFRQARRSNIEVQRRNRADCKNCAFLNISALAAVFYFSGRSASFLPSRGGTSMSVRMTKSEVDGVSVVELDVRITLGEESNSLREKSKSLVDAGKVSR